MLDEIGAVDPIYLTTAEKQHALVELSRAEARLQSTKLRVLAAGDDIAEATGDRSTASWLADQTREAHGTVRRHAALASSLEARWVQVADAFASGSVNLAQTRVMADALDALPKEMGEDRLAKAETLLVEEAAKLGPRELKVFGSRLLDYLAPEVADEVEYQRLLAEEARASAATRLSTRPCGDGTTDIHARVPDHAAGRLGTYLNAYTAPRRHHLHDPVETPFGPLAPADAAADEFARLPIARQRGEAFVALLENIPTAGLPRHGGTGHKRHGHPRLRHPCLRARRRDHLHRRPDHRGHRPPAGLPGRDHPRRPRREERDPRRRPHQTPGHRRDPQSPEPPRQGLHHPRVHDARRVLRGPPHRALVPRR